MKLYRPVLPVLPYVLAMPVPLPVKLLLAKDAPAELLLLLLRLALCMQRVLAAQNASSQSGPGSMFIMPRDHMMVPSCQGLQEVRVECSNNSKGHAYR